MSKILQTPIIDAITSFDPLYERAINFTYNDNQAVSNRVIIADNSTGTIVYDETQITMRLQHIIPANTLTAGVQYLIQIQVFDEDGNSSNLSEQALFYCFSTPQFNFDGIVSGEIYKNASILLNLNYNQTENEPIRSFQFMKYSYDKVLLEASEVLYSSSTMSYSFNSLENKTTYYFRAIGETKHGILMDTGYVEIIVSYEQIPLDILFNVENNYCNGYISLDLNIVNVEYEVNNENYTFKNGMLTLTNNSLIYNKGFSVENDFSLYVDAKQLKVGKFFTTNDNAFSLSIVKICDDYYCELTVSNSDFKQYVILPNAQLVEASDTPMIDVSYGNNNTLIFEIKRKNGYYSLNVYNNTEV